MLFLDELSEAEIGDYFGVTESRISQMKKEIKRSVENALCLDELWDSYHYDKDSSEVYVDWIAI